MNVLDDEKPARAGASERSPLSRPRALLVHMLGPPWVEWDGSPLTISRRQARALLYRLAADDHPLPRDHLAFLFWPDVSNTTARANLSRLLNLLRQALPHPDVLLTRKDVVGLNARWVWADTRAFAHLHDRLSHQEADVALLQRGIALYRGPFLDGFSLPGCPEFEMWLTRERQRWERDYLNLVEALVDVYTQHQEYHEAILWARRYLDIDEMAEGMHRRLIRLYAAVGDRGAALRQFETCAAILERELGVGPLPETRAAYQAALTGGRGVQVLPPSPTWTTLPSLEVDMVGREDALHRLQQACETTRQGRGRMVFVAGEAGIGKSRLLQEFIARVAAPTRVLVGTAHEAEQGIPYSPLVEALRPQADDLDWESLDLSPAALAEIAYLLPDVHAPSSTSPEPADAAHATRLVRALTDLVLALAHRQGHLILCLDNLHWADDATRAWLSYLARHLRRAPVLVLLAYRSAEAATVNSLRDEAKRLGIAEEIHLSSLNREHVHLLVTSAIGRERASPKLSERLHRESGGNPFFLLELLRAFVETGDLGPDGLAVGAPFSESEEWVPPETVCHAIDARLARLSPRDRQVLEAVAVLEAGASLDVIQTTSGRAEDEVVLALDTLVARHILKEEKRGYAFAHDLIRSRVYHHLSPGRRRLLHRRAGEALEKAQATGAAILARHFERGGDLPRAVDYYLQAGDRARDLYALREAVRHYERALILQREQEDDEGAARTLMRLGLAHHLGFAFEDARRAYTEGFRLWQRSAAARPERTLPAAPHPLRVDWPHVLTLDPARSHNANSGGVIDQLFSGLVEWSPTLNIVPDMALHWEVTDEGRRYLFHLREDVHWSDGRPVTAHDFEYAWKRVLSPSEESPHASLLYAIAGARAYHQGQVEDGSRVGVRALDATRLEVVLGSACSFFLHLLAHPVTRPVPRHVVETWGDAWATPPHLVTNGPFHLVEWDWAHHLTLTRDLTYRGRTRGNVENVVLYLLLDLSAREAKLRMFEENRLDVLGLWWGISPAQVAQMLRRFGGELISGLNLFVRYVALDVTRPPFDDLRLRQALAHATDRETLAHVIMAGYNDPALGGLIPPGMPGHSPNVGLPYAPDRARALLADAGYPQGRGFPTVTFWVSEGFEALGEYLRNGWQRVLGICVHLETLPWEAYLARIQGGDRPHAFLSGWVACYPDPDTFLRTADFRALTGWQHREYEALVERARGIADHGERMRLYRQADALLIHEAPIIPILYARRTSLLKPWVRTFPISPLKWWFWKDVVIAP